MIWYYIKKVFAHMLLLFCAAFCIYYIISISEKDPLDFDVNKVMTNGKIPTTLIENKNFYISNGFVSHQPFELHKSYVCPLSEDEKTLVYKYLQGMTILYPQKIVFGNYNPIQIVVFKGNSQPIYDENMPIYYAIAFSDNRDDKTVQIINLSYNNPYGAYYWVGENKNQELFDLVYKMVSKNNRAPVEISVLKKETFFRRTHKTLIFK